MKKHASSIGLVLGVVFVIMGVAYKNSSVWMLGLVFLALGLVTKRKR